MYKEQMPGQVEKTETETDKKYEEKRSCRWDLRKDSMWAHPRFAHISSH